MENIISKKFKQLNNKIDILKDEVGVADVEKDGLFDKNEASAMITGVMGGKGSLPDGTDIDTITHGGFYYLPNDRTYKNVPFTSPTGNYRMLLMVYRSYGENPRTNNPVIHQKIITIELTGNVQTAERSYYTNWINWYRPDGVNLWSGSQNTDGSKITLTESIHDFERIKVYWVPFNGNIKVFEAYGKNYNTLTDAYPNVPNALGANPAVSVEEVNIAFDDDGIGATAKSLLFYIQGGVTGSTDDSGKGRLLQIIGYPKV